MKIFNYILLWFLGTLFISGFSVLVDRVDPGSKNFLPLSMNLTWVFYLITKYNLDKNDKR